MAGRYICAMNSFIHQQLGAEGIKSVQALAKAGSDRNYVRVVTQQGSYIVCENKNVHENNTFIDFSTFFQKHGLPVPDIKAVSPDRSMYIQTDFGNETLLSITLAQGYTEYVKLLYKKSLDSLLEMQCKAGEKFDYATCLYARQFDQQMVLGDLNYFKYYFLDLHAVLYNKHQLLSEFDMLSKEISTIVPQQFMFRDFQGRNIMIQDDQPYFIDYQGGMKGPILYDVASLLWQAKAALPIEWKEELFEYYKRGLSNYVSFNEEQLKQDYSKLVLVRLLQVLGAYGLRGIIEKRTHFMSSIPQGLENIRTWLSIYSLDKYPILHSALSNLTTSEMLDKYKTRTANNDTPLKVLVQSFSYKKGGIPIDTSGNGGGFVFDCRGVLNPGRFEPYKKLTGRDQPVIDFLETETRIAEFLQAAQAAVSISIDDYLDRGFENIMISFGCTGGQHRSVYCADAMAKFLKEKYNLTAEVCHIQQEAKGWINE